MGKKLCEVNLLQFTFSRKLIFPDEYVALIDNFLKIFSPNSDYGIWLRFYKDCFLDELWNYNIYIHRLRFIK